MFQFIQGLFARKSMKNQARKGKNKRRFGVESLEMRDVPATFTGLQVPLSQPLSPVKANLQPAPPAYTSILLPAIRPVSVAPTDPVKLTAVNKGGFTLKSDGSDKILIGILKPPAELTQPVVQVNNLASVQQDTGLNSVLIGLLKPQPTSPAALQLANLAPTK